MNVRSRIVEKMKNDVFVKHFSGIECSYEKANRYIRLE